MSDIRMIDTSPDSPAARRQTRPGGRPLGVPPRGGPGVHSLPGGHGRRIAGFRRLHVVTESRRWGSGLLAESPSANDGYSAGMLGDEPSTERPTPLPALPAAAPRSPRFPRLPEPRRLLVIGDSCGDTIPT